ncbi:hypothetical protein [Dyadobacter sp. 676]|uniref:DUF3592 domain-containing protein n=1 Tax=Dyadobacter sp. 676 TaxID=3088362 RepID=A0AAU8FPI2_9BACT
MFERYASNEFYGDLLSHRLLFAKRQWEKIAYYTISVVSVVVSLALFARREEMNSYISQFENALVQWLFREGQGRTLFIGFAALIFLLNIGPTLLYYIRKYWLYRKSSMSLQAYLNVHYKESIRLPRAQNAIRSPRAFYVYVGHPVTGKVLPVEVSEDWYLQLEAGNKVHARYHPGSDNVVFLIRNSNLAITSISQPVRLLCLYDHNN